jgi:hypothetical protein
VKRYAGIKPRIVMPRCSCGPQWVKRVGLTMRPRFPVVPYEPTSSDRADWSVSCQNRKSQRLLINLWARQAKAPCHPLHQYRSTCEDHCRGLLQEVVRPYLRSAPSMCRSVSRGLPLSANTSAASIGICRTGLATSWLLSRHPDYPSGCTGQSNHLGLV